MFSIDLGIFYTLSNIARLPSFSSLCAAPANKNGILTQRKKQKKCIAFLIQLKLYL